MKVKMMTSAVTSNFLNLMPGVVYDLEDGLAKQLVSCKFAILVEEEEVEEPKEDEPKKPKRKPKKVKGE